MSIAPKIKNLKIRLKNSFKFLNNLKIRFKNSFKFLNFNFNNSFNKRETINITNNHIDYIKELELIMETWAYKYKNSIPPLEDFNRASAIFPNAYKQNPTHETVVLPFIKIAILHYENLIAQERKNNRDVSVYIEVLQDYKNKQPK